MQRYYEAMAADESIDPAVRPTSAPEELTIRVSWKLSDIDYPICLEYFTLEYYDTLYNETGFSRAFPRPFRQPRSSIHRNYCFIVRYHSLPLVLWS